MDPKVFSSKEERNEFIKNEHANGKNYRDIADISGISIATISRILSEIINETNINETKESTSAAPVSQNETKISPRLSRNETKLTNDEQIIYDFLKLVSPLVCSRGQLPEIKGNTDKTILLLQSKVNHGFQLDENKIYQGEGLDDMVCDMFRFRDWSITGE